MNFDTYLSTLAPEAILIIGACVVTLLGVARLPVLRQLTAPLALGVLALALMATAAAGLPSPGDVQPPGVQVTQLSYFVRALTLFVGALILLVNWNLPAADERGEFFGMMLFSIAGVTLTASADDLVLLFFALELVSVPTYVLVALSRQDARASEAAVKYFFLGALSAAIMVYGFSFLYGCAGTTSLSGPDGLAGYFASLTAFPVYAVIVLLFAFAGMAFKIAAVPFHVYAPDVYEGAASPVTGLLGFLPKLAGFVALIKLFEACNWNLPTSVYWLIWIVAAATMTVGNVLALLQTNVKRILAYSSIAHSGYMLIGLLVGPVAGVGPLHDGVAALLFYIAVYGLMNLGAFAVLSAFAVRGHPIEELTDLSGLSKRHPWSAMALAICAFSLMGFPPTAGFLGKVYIFSSAFSLPADHPFHGPLIVLAVIAVVNSAIAAVYYLRIATTAYLGTEIEPVRPASGYSVRVALAVCSLAMLFWFVWPAHLSDPAHQATTELARPVPAQAMQLALDDDRR